MGEREGLGPKVLVTCLPPFLGISPILFSSVAEGLRVFLTPGFRFGRLFPGMSLLHQLSCFTLSADNTLTREILNNRFRAGKPLRDMISRLDIFVYYHFNRISLILQVDTTYCIRP